MAGRRVGNYVIGEPIGMGSSAHVYEARHARLGHCVAVKVVRWEVRQPLRFEREVHALAEIRSRHVPQVHDSGMLPEGLPYVVMERLRGETLADLLDRRGRLGIDQTIEIGTQIAAALEATHAAGWVHRDVKPSNVVLHQEGDGRRVAKLCDFGIASPIPDASTQWTRRPQVDGTPEYMSPEQARGFAAGPSSDVFSLGAVLYEMLAGHSPFEHGDASPESIALAVTREVPRPVAALRSECPTWLAHVVHHALEKDTRRRFASASALRVALSDGLPAQELPLTRARATSSPLESPVKLPLRWGWRGAGLGLAISALGLGSWAIGSWAIGTHRARAPSVQSVDFAPEPPSEVSARLPLITDPEPATGEAVAPEPGSAPDHEEGADQHERHAEHHRHAQHRAHRPHVLRLP